MRKVAIWAVAAIASVWVLLPIYFILVGAFTERDVIATGGRPFFLTDFSLDTFAFFFDDPRVLSSALNSVIIAGLTVVFSLVLGAPAGYAMARFRFRGKNAFRISILTTRAFPVVILALPLAVWFLRLQIYDTQFAVALVHTALALPFAILITYSLFLGISKEYEEAAWTLGCSPFQAFRRITLPLALPGLTATAIFAFVISWNEVFAAAVLTSSSRPLSAYLLAQLSEAPLHFRLAGGVFLVVPSLVFVFMVRKYLFSLWGVSSSK